MSSVKDANDKEKEDDEKGFNLVKGDNGSCKIKNNEIEYKEY